MPPPSDDKRSAADVLRELFETPAFKEVLERRVEVVTPKITFSVSFMQSATWMGSLFGVK